jgi:hypothetical protein
VEASLRTNGRVVFPRATVFDGYSARLLTDFCRSAGLEWSIQDGALQFLDLGAALSVQPYILSPDSGLIGAPKIATDGKLNAQTLMLPGLRPGLPVVVESAYVKGTFRVIQCEYSGATHGDDWGVKLIADRSGSNA